MQTGLGNSKQKCSSRGALGLAGFGFRLVLAFSGCVGFLDFILAEHLAACKSCSARILDDKHVIKRRVEILQVEAIHHVVQKNARVTRTGDLHLGKHLAQNHFNVLVRNWHALSAVHILNFIKHVHIQRVFTVNAKNVGWITWTFHKWITGRDIVARMHKQMRSLRNVVLHECFGFA